jgi:hypothetical protein
MQKTFAITQPGDARLEMSRVGAHVSKDVPEHA